MSERKSVKCVLDTYFMVAAFDAKAEERVVKIMSTEQNTGTPQLAGDGAAFRFVNRITNSPNVEDIQIECLLNLPVDNDDIGIYTIDIPVSLMHQMIEDAKVWASKYTDIHLVLENVSESTDYSKLCPYLVGSRLENDDEYNARLVAEEERKQKARLENERVRVAKLERERALDMAEYKRLRAKLGLDVEPEFGGGGIE